MDEWYWKGGKIVKKYLVQKRDGSFDLLDEDEVERLIKEGKIEYDVETEWAKDENGIARPVGTYRTNYRYTEKKGDCIIVTACLSQLNLEEAKEKINIIRNFRDKYVVSLPNGKSLIDDYYKNAPTIIDNINNSPNNKEVYSEIYEKIKNIVDLLEKGHNKEALLYGTMVYQELKNKYGI